MLLRITGISTCCSGREPTDAHGINGHARTLLKADILPRCSGRELKTVLGTSGRVPLLLAKGVLLFYNGREPTGARGTSLTFMSLQKETDMSIFYSGYDPRIKHKKNKD